MEMKIPKEGFEIIYADMPWGEYTPGGTAKVPYKTMTTEELVHFPIHKFMAKRCVLFLWVTGPMLFKQQSEVFGEWSYMHGLTYQSCPYIWAKTAKGFSDAEYGALIEALRNAKENGQKQLVSALEKTFRYFEDGVPIGAAGPRPRLVKPTCEQIVTFSNVKRGRPFPLLVENQRQLQFAPKVKRGEHSRKPAKFRDLIVELLGDRPRIELFAREKIAGWSGHGDEYPGKGVNV